MTVDLSFSTGIETCFQTNVMSILLHFLPSKSRIHDPFSRGSLLALLPTWLPYYLEVLGVFGSSLSFELHAFSNH